jgi:hypothetical protein
MFCDNDQEWLEEVSEHLEIIANRTETPPQWYVDWKALGPKPTVEQRIEVYQAMRNADASLRDIVFNLIATEIVNSANKVFKKRFGRAVRAFCSATLIRNLGPELPDLPDQETLESIQRTLGDYSDEIVVKKLEACGEFAMARMFAEDPDGYEQTAKKGWIERVSLDGFEHWPLDLCRAVETCLSDDCAGLECDYRRDITPGGFEVLLIFPAFSELYGGNSFDGRVLKPTASFDLTKLRALFEDLFCFEQVTKQSESGEIVVVAIGGEFQGNEVCVDVLNRAPDDATPSIQIPFL